MVNKLIWLAAAGACGTLSRFALYEITAKSRYAHLPIGTFTVNILGSFLFGFIYVFAVRKLNLSPDTRFIILTGFMGAFTTFSTFAFDTANLMKDSQYLLAFGNVALQIFLGVAALGAGVLIARAL